MDIPNYDSGEKSDNGFTQLYKYMPKNTFRMLIAGNSGSGKTNLLSHILQSPLMRVPNRLHRSHFPAHFFPLIPLSRPFSVGNPDPTHFAKTFLR